MKTIINQLGSRTYGRCLAASAVVVVLLSGCQSWRELWNHEFPPYTDGIAVVKAEPVNRNHHSTESTGAASPSDNLRVIKRKLVEETSVKVDPKPPEAKRVDGSKTLVWSPFKEGVQIDISGIPAGAEAKDPFTGNVFLVPVE